MSNLVWDQRGIITNIVFGLRFSNKFINLFYRLCLPSVALETEKGINVDNPLVMASSRLAKEQPRVAVPHFPSFEG
jgi:hypothetical protein